MTLKLQHPFTLIVAGPSSCRKSTFVIRQSTRSSFVTLCLKILYGVSEDNAPHHLKDVSFVKGVPDFENPENVPTHYSFG